MREERAVALLALAASDPPAERRSAQAPLPERAAADPASFSGGCSGAGPGQDSAIASTSSNRGGRPSGGGPPLLAATGAAPPPAPAPASLEVSGRDNSPAGDPQDQPRAPAASAAPAMNPDPNPDTDRLGLEATATRVLAALDPPAVRRVLGGLAARFPRSTAALLCGRLPPAAAELLTLRLEAADAALVAEGTGRLVCVGKTRHCTDTADDFSWSLWVVKSDPWPRWCAGGCCRLQSCRSCARRRRAWRSRQEVRAVHGIQCAYQTACEADARCYLRSKLCMVDLPIMHVCAAAKCIKIFLGFVQQSSAQQTAALVAVRLMLLLIWAPSLSYVTL